MQTKELLLKWSSAFYEQLHSSSSAHRWATKQFGNELIDSEIQDVHHQSIGKIASIQLEHWVKLKMRDSHSPEVGLPINGTNAKIF